MRVRSFSLLMLVLPAVGAFAQDAPAVQVRTAFGASHYLHGDLGYTAPTLLVSVRAGHGALAIEPEFAVSWHEDTQVFGPNTSTTSNIRFQSFGVNAIGRAPVKGAGAAWPTP
jgi:hypothetical protein